MHLTTTGGVSLGHSSHSGDLHKEEGGKKTKHKRTNDKLQLAQMFPNKQSLRRFLQ